eukprot:6212237-Pleurochrysis_carterae.AAC.2
MAHAKFFAKLPMVPLVHSILPSFIVLWTCASMLEYAHGCDADEAGEKPGKSSLECRLMTGSLRQAARHQTLISSLEPPKQVP